MSSSKLFSFYWMLVVSFAILITVPFVFSRSWTSLAGVVRFCKVNYKLVERKKFGLICFPGLICCDQEPLWFLNVIEDDSYFLGVRLSTRCKIKFTLSLDCLQIIFSKLAFPSKVTWICSKVNWFIASLLFDLNYKFELIRSFAFSLAKSIYYK